MKNSFKQGDTVKWLGKEFNNIICLEEGETYTVSNSHGEFISLEEFMYFYGNIFFHNGFKLI